MASEDIKNILIIKPSALGDIALALPALSSIRKSFPDARITWLVRKEFAPLLGLTKNLDDIILFERRLLGKWYKSTKAFAGLFRFFANLRKPGFDIVIDLQGLFRTALFGWITGSRRRFGMNPSREFAGLFYTDRVEFDDSCVHIIDYNNKIISAVGASDIVFDYGLQIDDHISSKAKTLIEENGGDKGRYAVFVTGASHDRKCWPAEYFAELADRLHGDFDLSIVTVGTESERPRIEQLISLIKVPVVNLVAKTDIPVLAAVMKNASIVISNDTGPGHIAEAAGAKTVLIFGPTNPARILPYQKAQSVAAFNPFGFFGQGAMTWWGIGEDRVCPDKQAI